MKITTATVAVWMAFAQPSAPTVPTPQPPKCCTKCAGTGMVPTGGGETRVWCECPKECPCAAKRPKPSSCKDGKCNAK
jgi:hypothetical protein